MHFIMKICTKVLSEANRRRGRCRVLWLDNIKMDIGTGRALYSAWLGHDAMAGRFENCYELFRFHKTFY